MGGSPYPDAEETLLSLRKLPQVKLGIVTNKPTRIAELTLKHYLPKIQFDVIYGPEKVTKAKPHPEHLLEALAHIQVPPEKAWFIGDDPVDAECAKMAKVQFYGASYGFGRVKVAPSEMLSGISEILVKVAPILKV
jgi:HAD superfamily hydrolase (TIGR01549 family)